MVLEDRQSAMSRNAAVALPLLMFPVVVAAVIALAMHPAGQANGGTGVGGAQGAAGVGAIGVHGGNRLDRAAKTAENGSALGRIIAPESQGFGRCKARFGAR